MFGRLGILFVVAALAVGVLVRPSSGAGHEQTVVVRPGDTLWAIAARAYGGDPRDGIWRLERRNHLAGATLVPGERLVVPAG